MNETYYLEGHKVVLFPESKMIRLMTAGGSFILEIKIPDLEFNNFKREIESDVSAKRKLFHLNCLITGPLPKVTGFFEPAEPGDIGFDMSKLEKVVRGEKSEPEDSIS